MNIYEVLRIEDKIELIAQENEGEISEEQLQELVEAETKSLVQIENLCQYLRKLELLIETCRSEEERIKNLRHKADTRIKNVKKYLSPYIEKQGKVEAGTFKLSMRKSEKVVLADDFELYYATTEYVKKNIELKADKMAIKKAIKSGKELKGAMLVKNENLQIK